MSAVQIRQEAWKILRGRNFWFFRLVLALLFFGGLNYVVNEVLALGFKHLQIPALLDFQRAKLQAAMAGMEFVPSNDEQSFRLFSAALFSSFVQHIFWGTTMLGFSALLLKAARGEEKNWCAAALDGLARPFGMFWMSFRIAIQTVFLALGLVLVLLFLGQAILSVLSVIGLQVPSILAFALVMALVILVSLLVYYRYHLAWFVRVENPNLSVGACLAMSVRLMRGNLWRTITLDCAFWRSALLLFGLTMGLCGLIGALRLGFCAGYERWVFLGALALFSVTIALLVLIFCVVALSHAIYYRELCKEQGAGTTESTTL